VTGRRIANTSTTMRHPWPEGLYVQGGGPGTAVQVGGPHRAAFVEAFPPGTFLRGEGATVADAEDACWAKYQQLGACPHDQGFDRRRYVNGAGFCRLCGMWFSSSGTGLGPLPEYYEKRSPSLPVQAPGGDPAALGEAVRALLSRLARPAILRLLAEQDDITGRP